MKRTALTEKGIHKQSSELLDLCSAYDWDIRIDIACKIALPDKKRIVWGGYEEYCYTRRAKFTKWFVRKAFGRLNRKLRDDKHFPLMFVHEYSPRDIDESLFSGHVHAAIRNDTGYSNDIVIEVIKEFAVSEGARTGLDIFVQPVFKEGVGGYLAKKVNYDKRKDFNIAFSKMIKREADVLRNYRDLRRLEEKIEEEKDLREANQKRYRRCPWLAPV
jgi:hypothetical protein